MHERWAVGSADAVVQVGLARFLRGSISERRSRTAVSGQGTLRRFDSDGAEGESWLRQGAEMVRDGAWPRVRRGGARSAVCFVR